jgi:3-hydroxybutyryl-CoA dehydratase
VSPVAAAQPAGHAPELADAPASGAPAESVPVEEPGICARPIADSPAALAVAAANLFGCPFSALREGDRFITPARVVQEPDILQFADLTGDVHPQHVDPEWAAGSRFGEQIAHGLLVLSFAVGLLPLDPERVVALRRLGDAVFKQPVKIGDTLHVEGEISRTRELDPEHGLVEARVRIVNQHGRLAVRAKIELVWRA